MAQPPRYPDTGDEAGLGPEQRPTSDIPRWVVVAAIVIGIGLVTLMVALHVTGSIGPGAH